MDPNYSDYCFSSENPDNLQHYPNTQYENPELPSYDYHVSMPENVETSQKSSRVDTWDTREDMVLMSSWIFVSEDATREKNQKKGNLWSRVKEHHDATRTENPEGLGVRNKYLRMSETTTRDALMNFVNGVISCFGDEYLRKPNNEDLARLLHAGDQRGFPGRAPKVSYILNGHENNRAYYLTDGIYPSWSAFVKSITFPTIKKHKLFAQRQEFARKDVERSFGVLQDCFAFIRHPCLVWDKDNMRQIMIACIIMHNMIVEDKRETYLRYYDPIEFLNDMPTNRQTKSYTEDDGQPFAFTTERIGNLATYMANREQLRDREAHNALEK